MEIVIGLAVLAFIALVFVGLKRLNTFVEQNEQRAYVMNVLRAVEEKAALDREQGHP
jgi:hypothetical protein